MALPVVGLTPLQCSITAVSWHESSSVLALGTASGHIHLIGMRIDSDLDTDRDAPFLCALGTSQHCGQP